MRQSVFLSAVVVLPSLIRTHLYPYGAISRFVAAVRIVTSRSAPRTPYWIADANSSHEPIIPTTVAMSDQNMYGASARMISASNFSSHENRNRNEWLSIGDFLARQNLRSVLKARAAAASAGGKRSAAKGAAAAAPLQTLPVGNHGEIYGTGQGV